MECNKTTAYIDRSDIGRNIELPSDLKLHLEKCSSCSSYMEAALLSNKLILNLKDSEPKLSSPTSLSMDIMDAIDALNNREKSYTIKRAAGFMQYELLKPVLMAAAVLLLLWFGVEQFTVLHKINQLEKQAMSYTRATESQSFKPSQHAIEQYIISNYRLLLTREGKDLNTPITASLIPDFIQRQKFRRILQANSLLNSGDKPELKKFSYTF